MGDRLESFFAKTDVEPLDEKTVAFALRNLISKFGNVVSEAYIQSRPFSDDNTAFLLQFLWVLAHRESSEEALTSYEKYSRSASLNVASFNATIAKRACALLQDGNALHRHERVMLVKMLLRAINTIKREPVYDNCEGFYSVDIYNWNLLHKIIEWLCANPSVVRYNMCEPEKSDHFFDDIRDLMDHLVGTVSKSPIEIFKSILTCNRDHVLQMALFYLSSLTCVKQVECLETLDIEDELLMDLWWNMRSIDKTSVFIHLLASQSDYKRQALLAKWKGIDNKEGTPVFRPMWGMANIMGLLEDDRILMMLSPEQRALAIANGRALMEK